MFLFTNWALRLLGISGIFGASLFICGDLLYNHVPGSRETPTVIMSKLSSGRLIAAGILGMLGCWFYTLAAFHLYLAFRPLGDVFAFIFLLAFGVTGICYGIGHTAYFAIAAGAQVATRFGSDADSGGQLGNAFFKRVTTITYVPVIIASLMMLYGIVTGHSLYPRWMVIFMPIIIYLLRKPVLLVLKGHLQEIVRDSYDNMVLLVFYVLSTIVLWNGVIS